MNKILIIVLSVFLTGVLVLHSCKEKEDDEPMGSLPAITTVLVTDITDSSALSGGNISSDGGKTVTARGVCWSTNQQPTISDNKSVDGSGIGLFESEMFSLVGNTTYYVRAYATNDVGTAYGNEISFTTPCDCPETVTDIDGNVYQTILIGTQCWMAENLNVTKFANGDPIGTTNPATLDISAEINPKYQWAYNGDEAQASVYGRLYSWHVVSDSRGIAPTGWHVPSEAEWDSLINELGGSAVAGAALKEAGTTHWTNPNAGATNTSGFSALPSGSRNLNGGFYDLQYHAAWWTITPSSGNQPAAYKMLHHNEIKVFSTYYGDAKIGLAVRCVKD